MVARRKRNLMEVKDEQKDPAIADRYPFRHSLDTGDRGVLVLFAQSRLADHGTYAGALDGRYDREVTLAVRHFQSQKGLKITGIIDRKTWEAL
jgi:peptidoglycan hydrolase-like protein with peptidoglycan-binding domain